MYFEVSTIINSNKKFADLKLRKWLGIIDISVSYFSFRQQQHSNDIKISEAYNELKIKTAETQQTQIIYEETIRNLQDSQRSAEKLQKKLEVRANNSGRTAAVRRERRNGWLSGGVTIFCRM